MKIRIPKFQRPQNEARAAIPFKDLVDSAPVGIVRTTKDGRVLYANPALVRMMGYESLAEYLAAGRNILDAYADPSSRAKLTDLAEKHGRLLDFESEFYKKDGSRVWCRLHVRAVRGPDGKTRFLETFVEDISQARRTALALAESERTYRGVFENTGAGTVIIEKDMTISFANAGFAAITGYSKDEIEKRMKWPRVVADPDDLARMKNYHVSRRRESGTTPIEYEFILKTKAGERKTCFCVST